ncbi:lytic murein transglycosylase [Piscinibacter sp.]|uniref:lytic murein transglycosylase n=1 Tax=Piscinibacter sp. TaxID=1903157 RepID=UPI002C3576CC|nr:lytic murein transglycosylase [Albitalea sp.]HUG22640.1 lytic murein transglycosylase [Albitalea sp.]
MGRAWHHGVAAAALAAQGACAQVPAPAPAPAHAPLADCVASLRRELPSHSQVRPETFEAHVRNVQDLRPLIDGATQSQPEFQLHIWDYLARRTDAQRAAQGRELMQREARALAVIERQHGVDAATIVAVFGVETDYGRVGGAHPVVDATLSRACLNLGSTERRANFFSALWLLQEGLVQADTFKGSWAGAFGMTQFMPATFVKHMADGDGSGVPDIVNSVPDALATTANYLRGLGWADGMPWGIEVKVPEGVALEWNALERDHGCLQQAKPAGKCRSLAQWRAEGAVRVDGAPLYAASSVDEPLDGATPAALLMPAGPLGPAWLVTPNYQAIWRYNRADAYGLAIGLLSDALRGGPTQRTPWPTDDLGLSRVEFRELQALLARRGHCEVVVDGADGPRTGAAIRTEERRLGWAETGRGGSRMLAALRAGVGSDDHCAPGAVAMPASAPEGPASAPK